MKEQYNHFINPYNFIALEDGCIRKDYSQEKDKENLTGYIDCELTTKTDLIIPDKEENGVHPFFEIDGKPVIPGSELRGVIRSKFEALSNSCLSTSDPQLSFSGRSGPFKNVGYFNTKNGHLYKSEGYRLTNSFDIKYTGNGVEINHELYKYGDHVYFNYVNQIIKKKKTKKTKRVTEISKKEKLSCEGYIIIGENDFNNKRKVAIVPKSNQVEHINNEDNILEMLETELKQYRDERINKHLGTTHTGYKSVNFENEIIPCYYYFVDNYAYVSFAISGRIAYNRKLDELLDVKNNITTSYQACSSKDSLCPACHLFGTVSGNDLKVPSRVRVSDALLEGQAQLKEAVRLVLANPKYSNAAFYLNLKRNNKKENIDLFNADFVAGKNKGMHSLNVSDVTIRGRKEYWHYPNDKVSVHINSENKNVASNLTPLVKGSIFTFKVYFNNISQQELDQLISTIDLEGNPDLCYKIGHAKPYGYGSVRIDVKHIYKREFDTQTLEYALKEYHLEDESFEHVFNRIRGKHTFNDVRKMADFNTITDYIKGHNNTAFSYPFNDFNDGKAFDWFTQNVSKNTDGEGTIKYALPFVQDDLALKAFEKKDQGKKKKYKKR
ncbi:TIGR03986 family type III CRISPR-associated RAMP protein [Sharpea azabuensis]|uniref:TIGR03986 family type III CRISPR-associated RAMP protein n=1 Tax=Sharpea azabuensis TaxID=322505 RepID=UPI0013DD4BE9|nr:TIGR03986 family CRISPR-associated RAMP protein [Sharpea azabuensis]